MTPVSASGCKVDVVGPARRPPRRACGRATSSSKINGTSVASGTSLDAALAKTKPGQKVTLSVTRDGKPLELTARAGEAAAGSRAAGARTIPLSFLMTLYQVDDQQALRLRTVVDPAKPRELEGVNLRDGDLEAGRARRPDHASSAASCPSWALEVTKTYRVEPRARTAAGAMPITRPTTWCSTSAVDNVGDRHAHRGLSARRPHRPAHRRLVVRQQGRPAAGVAAARRDGQLNERHADARSTCPKLADDNFDPPWEGEPLAFIGVDAQYFSRRA